MHINYHPITFESIDDSGNHHQRILCNEIPDTSLALFVSLTARVDIEFQCIRARKKHE
jgi:hypothetical protein